VLITNIVWGIFLGSLFLLAFRYWSLFKNSQLSLPFIISIFCIKVFCGIAFYYIQIHYYHHPLGGDSNAFFNDARIIYKSYFTFKQDFVKLLFDDYSQDPYFLEKYYQHMNYWDDGAGFSLYNDNQTFIRLNTILLFLSHGNIYLHILLFNFLSMIGLVMLYRGLENLLSSSVLRMISVFCIPSVLLWCSAIHKETFVFFTIGALMFFMSQFLNKRNTLYLILTLLTAFISLAIKPYISVFIVVFILIQLFIQVLGIRKFKWIYIIMAAVFVLFCLSSQLSNGFNKPWRALNKKQMEFGFTATGGYFLVNTKKVVRLELSDSSKYILNRGDSMLVRKGAHYTYWLIDDLETTYQSNMSDNEEAFKLLHKMPKAGSAFQYHLKSNSIYELLRSLVFSYYIVLFKPLFFDAHNAFAYLSSIENAILLLIMLVSILVLLRTSQGINLNILILLTCIGIIFFIMGYTVNISGALSRYRAPVLPLFLAALFTIFPFYNNKNPNT
jgi:hypothetical protein